MFGKQTPSLSLKLAKPLIEILEVLGNDISQKTAEVIEGPLDMLRANMDGIASSIETSNKRTSYDLQNIAKRIETFSAIGEMLENANETNRLLNSQFYDEKIIYPMVRGLFSIFDFISAAITKLSSHPENEIALNYFSAIRTQLEEFLRGYDIEKFLSEKNAAFDPKTMKPLKREATGDEKLAGFVAESLQCGFRVNEKILRLESVSLYKYEASASQTILERN